MKTLLLALGLLFITSTYGQKMDHGKWDYMLKTFVNSEGVVNYSAWAQDPSLLQDYILEAQATLPKDDWSENEKKAYWINLYNAGAVMIIISHFPVPSIKKIENPFDRPIGQAKGKSISLNEIEKDYLIQQFQDPRIHVAINCGARSCPKLNNQAFNAFNVDSELNRLMKEFLKDQRLNDFSNPEILLVSSIFEWYEEEFGTTAMEKIEYINQFRDRPMRTDARVVYMEYDWSLNGF